MLDLYLLSDNLTIAEKILNLKGDVVECGVWRGGMSAALAEKLCENRHYYLFDSFEGMPPPGEADGEMAHAWFRGEIPWSYYDNCRAEEEIARSAMIDTGKPFTLVKGWFNDTVPIFNSTNTIALLRLDADWYDSILICLQYLYPKVVAGGIVVLDDYYTWDGCSRAVHDYLSATKSRARIHRSPNGVAYFIKND